MAQSYHIYEVARLPFEPNTPPEMRQEGRRPKHEPQQRGMQSKVVDRVKTWLSPRTRDQAEIGEKKKSSGTDVA